MSEDRAVTFRVDGDRALTHQYQMQCSLKAAVRILTSVTAYEIHHHGPSDGAESSLQAASLWSCLAPNAGTETEPAEAT